MFCGAWNIKPVPKEKTEEVAGPPTKKQKKVKTETVATHELHWEDFDVIVMWMGIAQKLFFRMPSLKAIEGVAISDNQVLCRDRFAFDDQDQVKVVKTVQPKSDSVTKFLSS